MKKGFIWGLWTALSASALGAQTPADTIRLTLLADTIALDEVVVTERRTPAATGRWSDMSPVELVTVSPVELVTVAGSNGDLYKALQTLPGVQVQGETGHLLVRGGSSEETQTYIDGLHVLKPYTSTGINTAARSRYSTFMFSGVIGVRAGPLRRPPLGDEGRKPRDEAGRECVHRGRGRRRDAGFSPGFVLRGSDLSAFGAI